MTSPIPVCPACSGPLMVGHPEGMVFDHDPDGCTLRPFEDGTRANDFTRAEYYRFGRPATPTEMMLLGALGFEATPGEVTVTVDFPAAVIRRRTFDGLRTPTPAPPAAPPAPADTTTTEEGTAT